LIFPLTEIVGVSGVAEKIGPPENDAWPVRSSEPANCRPALAVSPTFATLAAPSTERPTEGLK
jgi:hypothetical protein